MAGSLGQIGVQRDEATVTAIMGRLQALMSKCRSVRCTGSCAMNMVGVAMGRLDAFYEIGFGGPWDCAGAAIIVTEAGGQVLDPAGGTLNVMSREVSSILATVPDGPKEPHALPIP
ncbi:hypothetical protein CYMTET_31176 [Cymbomonas tetramitiformis]|uniref:Inositol-phosphate phosphatase n=1 Tax=Cymbomonas tetramitiformis TaxID=36881 RepID=A0AAE0FHB8_9CHLO|nr:hypothetical protein CYMTET_31176 [Cymbomonas tetramitiformis]